MRSAFSKLRSTAETGIDIAYGFSRTRADERPDAPAEAALADAERTGFRLAVIGRTCALVAIALFYLEVVHFPRSIYIAGLVLTSAAIGLAAVSMAGSAYERIGRFACFAFDAAVVSAAIAIVPLSSGGDVPQNLVFFSSRTHYYYVVVALSVLALSPALVLWTGLWAIVGLASAIVWIMAQMDHIVGHGDMPSAPSREEYLAIVLNPDFLGIGYRINELVVLALVTGIVALAVHRARSTVRAHIATEARRRHIQQIFGRYVPMQIAEQLIDAGQLAPQQRDASILFADIAGFTTLSEALPPAELIGLLNSFFSAATAVIDGRGGIVVNHVGDALIASFNAPLPIHEHALRAIDAARDLLALVRGRSFDGHHLRLRIGIATGPVAAGSVGGSGRQTYTLYGDTVNLAQRLQELNKEFNTNCLICGTTINAARSSCADAVAIGPLQVRGRASTVNAYTFACKRKPQ